MAMSFHRKQGSVAADTLVAAVFMTWTKTNLWLLEMIIDARSERALPGYHRQRTES